MGYGFRYVLGAVILIAVLFAGLSLVPTALNQWLGGLSTGQQQTATPPPTAAAPAQPAQGQNGAYQLPVPPPPQPPVNRNTSGVSKPPRKAGPTMSGASKGNTTPSAPPSGAGGNSGGFIGSLPRGTPGSSNQGSPGAAPNRSAVAGGAASPPPPGQWNKLGNSQPDDGQGTGAIGWRQARENLLLLKTPSGDPYRAMTKSMAPLTIIKGSRLWAIRQEGDWLLVRSPGRTLGWVNARDVEPLSSTLQLLYGG